MKRVPSLLWRGRDETCCYLLAHYGATDKPCGEGLWMLTHNSC